jgi:tetratricopeptide (TPR) repeat protein
VARHVPWRGGLIALPVITAIGAPVWLDVPDFGEIIVDEQIYITELYPLLNSDQEVDRERAYIRLKEIAQAQPTIQETAPDDVAVATSTASAQTGNVGHDRNATASSSYTKGLAALREDDFDAAIQEFTAAIAADPSEVFSYIRRGTAYEEKGDAASAIGDYRKVLKLVDAETGAKYAAKIRRLERR